MGETAHFWTLQAREQIICPIITHHQSDPATWSHRVPRNECIEHESSLCCRILRSHPVVASWCRARCNSIRGAIGAANAGMVSMLCSSHIFRFSVKIQNECFVIFCLTIQFNTGICYTFCLTCSLLALENCGNAALVSTLHRKSHTKKGVGPILNEYFEKKLQKYFRF